MSFEYKIWVRQEKTRVSEEHFDDDFLSGNIYNRSFVDLCSDIWTNILYFSDWNLVMENDEKEITNIQKRNYWTTNCSLNKVLTHESNK